MIKAIIFDCYGVLVGTGFWNIYNRAGGDADKDKVFINDWLHRNSLGEVTGEELTEAMAKELGITVAEWRRYIEEDEVPSPQLLDLIRTRLLGKYKLAVISNAGRGALDRKLSKEQQALFDAVIVSAEVGLVKPDPAIFAYACEKLGVDPKQTVFIDDHEEYLAGAQSLGIKTILYKNFEDCHNQLVQLLAKES
ncbi:MAG: HAD family phosphatase [Candidatus Saccharibacteria bacterium]|nr:HAD family phosphatase [Candidatus Saccharibacteria bacterium]